MNPNSQAARKLQPIVDALDASERERLPFLLYAIAKWEEVPRDKASQARQTDAFMVVLRAWDETTAKTHDAARALWAETVGEEDAKLTWNMIEATSELLRSAGL